jgi:hypothetical protein
MQAGIILEEQRLRRSFLKTSISVDTDKKVILDGKSVKKQIMKSNLQNAMIKQSNRTRKSDFM